MENTHVRFVISLGEWADVFFAPIKELCLVVHRRSPMPSERNIVVIRDFERRSPSCKSQ